jgi:hypothetical protein
MQANISMEQIIERIETINSYYSVLTDSDQQEFNQEINEVLSEMNTILEYLEKSLANYQISEEKYNKIELTSMREHIITKKLFNIYFALNEQLKDFTKEQLNFYEKCQNFHEKYQN